VASFRLSAQAEAELIALYDHSEAQFGRYQADAYLAGLERTFGLLADFPGIGKSADDNAARLSQVPLSSASRFLQRGRGWRVDPCRHSPRP
jgi:plasmid stabilization system protein ParE